MRSSGVILLAACLAACAPAEPNGNDGAAAPAAERERTGRDGGEAEAALRGTLERAHALADSVEDLLRPLPLMRPADEQALRRYGQSVHLPRARSLGVRPANAEQATALVEEGRLVRLEESTRHWVLKDLDPGRALVTPDTRALLRRIGARFQERLDGMGIPPYRIEITSALRTADDQARLRRTNVNAAQGVSTHEFGTTVDIAYFTFAPPAELPKEVIAEGPEWLDPYLEEVARPILAAVAGQKSRELQAILGEVLREMQAEGLVLVTFERLQPVYHITVGRRISDGEG